MRERGAGGRELAEGPGDPGPQTCVGYDPPQLCGGGQLMEACLDIFLGKSY